MSEETFEVTDLPKPVDMLFGALAVLLIVLGAVLVIANRDSADYRAPVVAPAQLIARYDAVYHTREG